MEFASNIIEQTAKFVQRFRFISVSEGCRPITAFTRDVTSFYQEVIEKLEDGTSQAIYFPFSSSTNFIPSFLGVLAHSFVERDDYPNAVVVTRNGFLTDMYDRIEDSDGIRLKFWHPRGEIGKDGRIFTTHNKRSLSKSYRLLFVRPENIPVVESLENIEAIALDLTSINRYQNAISDWLKVRELSERRTIPLLIWYDGSSQGFLSSFVNSRMAIRSFPRSIFKYPWRARDHCKNSEVELGKRRNLDIRGYPLWLEKTSSSRNFPLIRYVESKDEVLLRVLHDDLKEIFLEGRRCEDGSRFLSNYSSAVILESIIRGLAVPSSMLDAALAASFGPGTLGERIQGLSLASKRIYEISPCVGIKFLDYADTLESISRVLRERATNKTQDLVDFLKSDKPDKPEVLIVRTQSEKIAYSSFIASLELNSNNTMRVETVRDMENGGSINRALITSVPTNWCNLLFNTSSAAELIFLCYPWESLYLSSRLRASLHNYSFWCIERNIGARPKIVSDRTNTRQEERLSVKVENIDPVEYFLGFNPHVRTIERLIEDEYTESITLRKYSYVDKSEDGVKIKIITELGTMEVRDQRKLTIVREKESLTVSAGEILPGDEILVGRDFAPHPMSEYVWEIMEKLLPVGAGAAWRKWKILLRDYLERHISMNYKDLFVELKQKGASIETPVAVYEWMHDDDLIGPRDKKTMQAIASLLDTPDEELAIWWASIKQVRSTLHSLYSNLWKLARSYGGKSTYEDRDVTINKELNITLSDIANLVVLTKVTEVGFDDDE